MRRLLVYLITVALPTAMLLADVQGAMMQPYGKKVTVNGSTLSKAGSIFAGDKIMTGRDSGATITVEGSNVLLPARASVELGNNLLRVDCGGASISTTRGMSVRAGNVTFSPVSEQATKFEVMQSSTWLQVVVREGKVLVRNGDQSQPMALAPGNSFTLKSAGRCAGDSNSGAIAGGIAGGAAGLVLALVRTAAARPTISPALP